MPMETPRRKRGVFAILIPSSVRGFRVDAASLPRHQPGQRRPRRASSGGYAGRKIQRRRREPTSPPDYYGIIRLMCMLDTIRAKRKELYAIADRNKIDKMYLFGSCARKDERSDSDIDFLVTFKDGASLLNQVHMRDDLQALFGVPVDVVSSRGLSPYIGPRILAEAVPV